MNVALASSITNQLPGFSLGIIRYAGVTLSDSPKMLQGRINLFVETLRNEREGSQITDIEGIREWRAMFKKLGIDPSRYRASSEPPS